MLRTLSVLAAVLVSLIGTLVVSAAPAGAASVYCTYAAPKTVRYGDTGQCVKVLQIEIGGLAIDSQFGPATLSAVKLFQRANGLTVDGVVGPKTWNAIKLRKHPGTVVDVYGSLTFYACRDRYERNARLGVQNRSGSHLTYGGVFSKARGDYGYVVHDISAATTRFNDGRSFPGIVTWTFDHLIYRFSGKAQASPGRPIKFIPYNLRYCASPYV
jgi:peptidoglycan hydrolase-like protein with peptidoglycan-binding domain